LPFPSLEPKSSGKTIVIWGASSSTGVLFLQTARAAGVTTIAVASERNHELCKSYGAAAAIDYRQSSAVSNVVEAVKGVDGHFVGVIDCVSSADASVPYCLSMLEQLGGGELGLLLPDMRLETPGNVRVTNIFGLNKITHRFWRDHLTPALEQGKLKCAPEPLIVGAGLGSFQKALDVQKRGVSAKKVVVTL
jgi:NADPH:quinone reductase-like Zn-dependent oxidoreductase